MWAMGRIASAEASADGKKIVYRVGYYSVKENKNRQVICTTDADGKNNRQLTTGTQSETDPTWTNGRIAYLSAGEIWTMEHDGTDRRRISDTKGTVEAFKFSPDGKKVIIVKSLPFNDIIKKNRRSSTCYGTPYHRHDVPSLGPLRGKYPASFHR